MRGILLTALILFSGLAFGQIKFMEVTITDADMDTLRSNVDILAADVPAYSPDNDAVYVIPWLDFEVDASNAYFVSFVEVVAGADSVLFFFDVDSATYERYEVFVTASFSGDATDETVSAELRLYEPCTYASATAADTLNATNYNSAGSTLGTFLYTVTPDAASRTASRMIANLTANVPYRNSFPFYLAGTTSGDSTGYALEIVVKDSSDVSFTLEIVPRTL